jgi:hypothetical protein
MTPAPDRIDYGKLTALVNARPDQGTRHALHAALNGINDAERTMRDKTAALDDTEAHLDATRLRADTVQIQRAAADLDRASTARDLHWATAAALLTQDELGDLTPAAPPPGK